MQTQITNAFASLNARLHASDQAWAAAKIDGANDAAKKAEEEFKAGDNAFAIMWRNGRRSFDRYSALAAHFGSKSMMELLTGRGRQGGLDAMAKNTDAVIARRDAQIIKALNKVGITEIPEFELVECSDGVEGYFNVAGHTVHIRTILAGGYNIQRLHQRTLVKVR